MLRPILAKEALQIEVTNACLNRCANCTRLVGHHPEPYMMDLDYFREVVDSLREAPMMIGVMGGEPLLHPEFERMCRHLQGRLPPRRLGLWSSLPPRFSRYAKLIADTFGAVLPNSHARERILHCPVLVRSDAVLGERFRDAVEGCWIQRAWSASVNPRGAYFCEVAASLDLLLKTGTAFDVHARWWLKKPREYEAQVRALCSKCGVCLCLTPRPDSERVDDLDDWWLRKLKKDSPKVRAGLWRKFGGSVFDRNRGLNAFRRDIAYLRKVGRAFGLKLDLQANGYLKPRAMVR